MPSGSCGGQALQGGEPQRLFRQGTSILEGREEFLHTPLVGALFLLQKMTPLAHLESAARPQILVDLDINFFLASGATSFFLR